MSRAAVPPAVTRPTPGPLRRAQKGLSRRHLRPTHENPYQLLVATILSAQCTDARVNMVTPELFRRFPDPGRAWPVPTPPSWRR